MGRRFQAKLPNLGNDRCVRKLRVMADYDCWPLWDDGTCLNVDPASLPLSADLVRELSAWSARFDAILNRDDPARSAFPTLDDRARFLAEGRRLSDRVKSELGPGWIVRYAQPGG